LVLVIVYYYYYLVFHWHLFIDEDNVDPIIIGSDMTRILKWPPVMFMFIEEGDERSYYYCNVNCYSSHPDYYIYCYSNDYIVLMCIIIVEPYWLLYCWAIDSQRGNWYCGQCQDEIIELKEGRNIEIVKRTRPLNQWRNDWYYWIVMKKAIPKRRKIWRTMMTIVTIS